MMRDAFLSYEYGVYQNHFEFLCTENFLDLFVIDTLDGQKTTEMKMLSILRCYTFLLSSMYRNLIKTIKESTCFIALFFCA